VTFRDVLVKLMVRLMVCVELIGKLPIISDQMLATAVHRELCQTTIDWGFPGLLATLRLAWAITIRSLSQYHLTTAGQLFAVYIEPSQFGMN